MMLLHKLRILQVALPLHFFPTARGWSKKAGVLGGWLRSAFATVLQYHRQE
jgi:hypothetical protein